MKAKFRIFFIVIFSLSLISFSQTKSFADDATQIESDSISATNTPKMEKIAYDLPFPGLLPGNPLYSIKVFRDKLVSTLINDPFKKAEFDLLASDKRTNAGVFLFNQKKEDLAIDTISKGNNYFDDAIGSIEKAKSGGVEVKPLLEKMKLSIRKHQEVLAPYEKKISKGKRAGLGEEVKRMRNFEKSVVALFPQK